MTDSHAQTLEMLSHLKIYHFINHLHLSQSQLDEIYREMKNILLIHIGVLAAGAGTVQIEFGNFDDLESI